MEKNIPETAAVQLLTEKGKMKDMFVCIKTDQNGPNLFIADTPNPKWNKNAIPIRRIISEMKPTDPTKCTMVIVTTEQEITLVFKNASEASAFNKFIVEKSDVHAENNAISQLDEEMRSLWPFPGGSFF